jgi:hypothetical protein
MFEYMQIGGQLEYEHGAGQFKPITAERLNTLGQRGWRVVSVHWVNGEMYNALLERPVETPKSVKG